MPVQELMTAAKPIVVEANGLTKIYHRGNEEIRALDNVSFVLNECDFTAIVGPSGAGKTTLLQLLGCMDTPSAGEISIGGQSTRGLADSQLTRLRREQVGFVFQNFGLLPTLSVIENITLPTLFSRRKAKARADELLDIVGLKHRRDHRPHELSGGEMQRAAIARALINSPKLLLADEPTGNLDSVNGAAIIDLFHKLNHDGLSVVVVTHNAILAESAHRIITMRDGKIESDTHS